MYIYTYGLRFCPILMYWDFVIVRITINEYPRGILYTCVGWTKKSTIAIGNVYT